MNGGPRIKPAALDEFLKGLCARLLSAEEWRIDTSFGSTSQSSRDGSMDRKPTEGLTVTITINGGGDETVLPSAFTDWSPWPNDEARRQYRRERGFDVDA